MTGNLSYTLAQFLMLLTVVRLTDEERVGRYALALALTAPVYIFAGLKMRHVQVTDAKGLNRSGEYIAVRFLTSLMAFAIVALLARMVTTDRSYLLLILSVSAFKAVESQVDVLYGVMQRLERLDLVARSMMLRAAFGALAFAVVLGVTNSVVMSVSLLTLITAIFVVVDSRTVLRLGASPFPDFSGTRLWKLIWLALPLGLSVSVSSLTTNMPRYYLEALEGTAAVGIYATISYVLVATSLVGGSATEAAIPRLSNYFEAGQLSKFRTLTAKLGVFGFTFGILGTLAAWMLGRPVLTLVFGEEYGRSSSVLVVLMLAATMQYTSLAVGAAVYGMRLFRVQVPINVLALIVAAVVNYPMVDRWGLLGAAWSVVITQAVLAGCYAFLYLKKLPPGDLGA